MSDSLPIGHEPTQIVFDQDTPPKLAHVAGDGVIYTAPTAEELTGEAFNPVEALTLAVGDARTLTGPTWVRTESPHDQSNVIVIPPDPSE